MGGVRKEIRRVREELELGRIWNVRRVRADLVREDLRRKFIEVGGLRVRADLERRFRELGRI